MARDVGVDIIGRDKASPAFNSAARSAEGLHRSVSGALKTVGGIAAGVVAGQVALGALGKAAGFAKDSIFGFNSTLEQSQIGFTTMLGSGQKAQAFLDDLSNFAKATPFEFQGLVKNSQLMLGMGISAKDVIPYLTALGDSTASVGGDADELNNTILAFSQIASKGTLSMDNMNQLLEGGVPTALKVLAAQFHVTTGEMVAMISSGKVQSSVALPLLVQGLEKGTTATAALGGMMDKQSRTFQGALSNINDSLQQSLAQSFKPFFEGASSGAQKLATWLSGDQFAHYTKALTNGLQLAGGAAKQFFAGFKSRGAANPFSDIVSPMQKIGGLAKAAFDSVAATVQTVWPVVVKLSSALLDLASSVLPLLLQAWEAAKSPMQIAGQFIANVLIPAIRSLAKWIREHQTVVQTLAVTVLTAVAAWKAFLIVKQASKALKDAKAAITGLNTAMKANPIGLWVTAIAALAAGLIYAYKHSKTFRDIVNGLWKVIKTAAKVMIDFFTKDIPNAFNNVLAFVKRWGLLFLGPVGVIIKYWGQISGFFVGLWRTVSGAFSDAWNSIVTGLQTAWKTVSDFFAAIPGEIAGFFAGAGSWLAGVGASIFGGLKDGLTAAWAAVTSTFGSVKSTVLGWFTGAGNWLTKIGDDIFSSLGRGITSALAWVKSILTGSLNALFSAVNWTVDHTVNAAISGINTLFGWAGVHIPDVPHIPAVSFAKGGITMGPTLALMGDNRTGHEAALPLDSSGGSAALTRAVEVALENLGSNSKFPDHMTVELDFGGFTMLARRVDRENKRQVAMRKGG